ncbi:telomerase inhibitor [Sporothrix bragantina]|uniref:PinX1-related protein 1 n=1 Tax=Sporothrix bragantina TaxID=671064 RepID=A0ABP0AKH4_9PEZI
MGLAGVKNKRKIGDDPNNTKWARNTNNFGQKILRAHGWEPGQYLGQKDAAHAESYTAASASHIRAFMREDNLGIGASAPDVNQCTGLDVFKDLLGRLNGQSDESIEKQRQARENVKMTLYVERRFGPMRFVRGGFLIGDDETKAEEEEEKTTVTTTTTTITLKTEESTAAPTPSTSSSSDEEATDSDAKAVRKKTKKDKKKEEKKEKSKKRKATSDAEDDEDDSQTDKKRKRSKNDDASEDESEKKKSKKSKKDKKDKKDKKEKKDKSEKKEMKEKKDKKKDKKRRRDEESGEDTGTATPSESEQAAGVGPRLFTSTSSSSRLARRRYINQKRAAVSDPQALKQIFMIKA